MVDRLRGKVALVTGAATGIGRATAECLAREGANVVLADKDGAGVEEAARDISALGGQAVACRADVSLEADVEGMIRVAVSTFGRLDVLHNNAAITAGPTVLGDVGIEEADPEIWVRMYQVNVVGMVLGCKYAIPVMRRHGGGSIINTSSAAGLAASGVNPSYGATKGAVNLLTKHVATTHGREGIRCNAVAPGIVLTEKVMGRLSGDATAEYTSKASLGRAAVPSDLASAVAFLASDEAALITGQIISIDGGLLSALPYASALLPPLPGSTAD